MSRFEKLYSFTKNSPHHIYFAHFSCITDQHLRNSIYITLTLELKFGYSSNH